MKKPPTILKFFLIPFLVLILLPSSVMALPVDTSFWFSDSAHVHKRLSTTNGVTSYLFSHVLKKKNNFYSTGSKSKLAVEAGDEIDIRSAALSVFKMLIKTDTSMTLAVTIDDVFLAERTFTYDSATDRTRIGNEFLPHSDQHMLTIDMVTPEALNALDDMVADVEISVTSGEGSFKIMHSQVGGTGVINPQSSEVSPTPEPISLVVLISGLGIAFVGLKKKKF